MEVSSCRDSRATAGSLMGSRGGDGNGSAFNWCVHSWIVRASACTVDSVGSAAPPSSKSIDGRGELLFQKRAVHAEKSGTCGKGGKAKGLKEGDDSDNLRAWSRRRGKKFGIYSW